MPFARLRHLAASALPLISLLPVLPRALAHAAPAAHVFFNVQLSSSVSAPVSGRILVFVKRGAGDKEVDTQEFHPEDTWVTAKEVHDLAPGASIELDGTDESFPRSFAALPPGDYEAQAILDPDHTYNYSGRGPQDWISPVVPLAHFTPGASPTPTLTLQTHPAEDPQRASMRASLAAVAKPGEIEEQEFESPLLTRFWGRPPASAPGSSCRPAMPLTRRSITLPHTGPTASEAIWTAPSHRASVSASAWSRARCRP